jgi:hypothetical protein
LWQHDLRLVHKRPSRADNSRRGWGAHVPARTHGRLFIFLMERATTRSFQEELKVKQTKVHHNAGQMDSMLEKYVGAPAFDYAGFAKLTRPEQEQRFRDAWAKFEVEFNKFMPIWEKYNAKPEVAAYNLELQKETITAVITMDLAGNRFTDFINQVCSRLVKLPFGRRKLTAKEREEGLQIVAWAESGMARFKKSWPGIQHRDELWHEVQNTEKTFQRARALFDKLAAQSEDIPGMADFIQQLTGQK